MTDDVQKARLTNLVDLDREVAAFALQATGRAVVAVLRRARWRPLGATESFVTPADRT